MCSKPPSFPPSSSHRRGTDCANLITYPGNQQANQQFKFVPISKVSGEESIKSKQSTSALNTDYKLAGNQAKDIVSVATAQKNLPRNVFGYTTDWCAYFTCWAGRTAGANFPKTDLPNPREITRWFVNNNAGTFYYFRDANYQNLLETGTVKNKNLCIKSSRNSFIPQEGDLIIYRWSDEAPQYNWSHIGIVTGYPGNGLVSTVEGNVGGGTGKVDTFNRYYNSQVVAFVRPNYKNSTSNSTSNKPQYFKCNVQISCVKGKTVNLYNNPGDTSRVDYFDKGQSMTSNYGIKLNGATWYRVTVNSNGKVRDVWLKFESAKMTIKDLSASTITSQAKSTTLSVNTSNVTLDLASKNSQTISLSLGGDLPNKCKLDASISNDVANINWVNYTGGTVVNALITGKKAGTANITFSIIDGNTQKIYATKTVQVTVKQ